LRRRIAGAEVALTRSGRVAKFRHILARNGDLALNSAVSHFTKSMSSDCTNILSIFDCFARSLANVPLLPRNVG
jgi:hypothetical protein